MSKRLMLLLLICICTSVNVEAKRPSKSYKVKVRLTYYSGKDDAFGSRVSWASVKRATPYKTLAADVSIFPYGTKVNIPTVGTCRVEDTGTAVIAKKASNRKIPVLDLYVATNSNVDKLSKRMPEYLEVTVYPVDG